MKKYIKKSAFDCTQFDDDWIIINTENFTVTKVNKVGGYCWTLLESEQTAEAIMQAVQEGYPTIEELTTQDIEQFLDELLQYGLLTHEI
jgi:HEPN domain-containing protein